MIDALALAAIAHAVDHAGDVDTALAAVGRADPLLRAAARRRIRTAWADALLGTHEKQADGGLHALRLAYLALARAMPAACDDVDSVARAFAEVRAHARPPRRFWWATTGALVGILAAAGATFAIAGVGPLAPRVVEPAGPPARGAFATGGVPAPLPQDAVIRRVLARDLPEFLIALDRASNKRRAGVAVDAIEKEMDDAAARATGAEARAALGEGAVKAVAALISAAKRASTAPPGNAGDAATQPVLDAAASLDDELAAIGAGYFVDADVIYDGDHERRLPIAYSFAVERVDLLRTRDATVRALLVRRIDRLNWVHSLLGFTRPDLRAAVVLLDQLEDQTITLIAPGLAPNASVKLFDPDAKAAERAAVEARAGELSRIEYGGLPGLDAAAARKLGEALGRRGALLDEMEKRARARGMTLIVPGKLSWPEELLRAIEALAEPEEMTELRAIEATLAGDAPVRAFAVLRDALAETVERHEAQHRLDVRKPLRMPAELSALVGPAEKDGHERRHATRARAELSAYLAELSRDARTTRVGLARVARFLFDRRQHGQAESYAALVILEGLAAGMGLPAGPPLLSGGAVDRAAVGRLYLAIVEGPPDRLRDAASRLWAKLFGAPLPEMESYRAR